jgi:hypothetical protein
VEIILNHLLRVEHIKKPENFSGFSFLYPTGWIYQNLMEDYAITQRTNEFDPQLLQVMNVPTIVVINSFLIILCNLVPQIKI